MPLLLSNVDKMKAVLRRPSTGASIELGILTDLTIDKAVAPANIPTPAVEEDYQILMKAVSGGLMSIMLSTRLAYSNFTDVSSDFYAMIGSMSDVGDYTENSGDGVFNALPGDNVLLELYDCVSGNCTVFLRKSGYITDVTWSIEWSTGYIVEWTIKFMVGITV